MTQREVDAWAVENNKKFATVEQARSVVAVLKSKLKRFFPFAILGNAKESADGSQINCSIIAVNERDDREVMYPTKWGQAWSFLMTDE